MIELDHIQISTRKESSRGKWISIFKFFFEVGVFSEGKIKIKITDMMTVRVRFTDIEMRVDSLGTRISGFKYYRFVELEVFLIWIIAWLGDNFSKFDKSLILILIVAEYPEIPRIIEIPSERIHTELMTFSMNMSSGFEELVESMYRTVAVESHRIERDIIQGSALYGLHFRIHHSRYKCALSYRVSISRYHSRHNPYKKSCSPSRRIGGASGARRMSLH
jgi:hypothetical protein